MELLVILFGIFAAFAVPIGIIATVQYCVLADIELSFKKLLLFSWMMVIAFVPFSFYYAASLIFALISDDKQNFGEVYILTSFTYLVFGWLVCSALYGKMILPDFSSDKINLP